MQSGQKISLEYHEEMRGFYGTFKGAGLAWLEALQNFKGAAEQGQTLKNKIKCLLRISIADVDGFIKATGVKAKITGSIDSPKLGGRLQVESGHMVINSVGSPGESVGGEIAEYLIHFKNQDGGELTLKGFKKLSQARHIENISQLTTLYFKVFEGFHTEIEDQNPIMMGTLCTNAEHFAKQMTTFRSSGPSRWLRSNAVCRFNETMYKSHWDPYQDKLWESEPEMWRKHIIPTNTLEGVHDAEFSTYPFNTKDGLGLTLTRFNRESSNKKIVLLIHGLTTSTDMFIMPEHYNLVQYLLDKGYHDVWSLDWRGSRRFPYNLQLHRHTIDHVALYDIPAAINTIRQQLGPDVEINCIAHCVGAIGLMASLSCGRVTGLKTVICNSVSLSPRVHNMSKLKISVAPDLLEYVLRYNYISPDLSFNPKWTPGRWLQRLVSMRYKECDNEVCHMISFMWGWGDPAVFEHENMSPITHNRLAGLFGGTTVHYYRHLRKMIFEGAAVPYISHRALPRNYLDAAASVKLPPTLLMSGQKNKVFPGANLKTYEELRQLNPRCSVEYEEISSYGHQDIFMGRAADKDVFPKLIQFLDQHD